MSAGCQWFAGYAGAAKGLMGERHVVESDLPDGRCRLAETRYYKISSACGTFQPITLVGLPTVWPSHL